MNRQMKIGMLLIVFFAVFSAGCLTETTSPTPKPTVTEAPTTSPPVTTSAPTAAPVDKDLVAHGGRLYDKWWKEIGATEPAEDHSMWATQSTNTRSGSTTWRCKECHGWDYKGVDGAYGSGSHFTGFSGIFDAAQTKTIAELTAAMKGATNPDHDFTSTLGDAHIEHVVLFLKSGTIDNAQYIDYDTKKAIGGNPDNGMTLFEGTCKVCHGADGRMINFKTEENPEYIGGLANGNPWESVHKILVGHPGSEPPMPSALVNGWSMQDVMDVLVYSQTLPEE